MTKIIILKANFSVFDPIALKVQEVMGNPIFTGNYHDK